MMFKASTLQQHFQKRLLTFCYQLYWYSLRNQHHLCIIPFFSFFKISRHAKAPWHIQQGRLWHFNLIIPPSWRRVWLPQFWLVYFHASLLICNNFFDNFYLPSQSLTHYILTWRYRNLYSLKYIQRWKISNCNFSEIKVCEKECPLFKWYV